MNKKVLVVLLLVALFCISGLECQSRDCDCSWTSRGCGRNDGTYCWSKCCGRGKRSIDFAINEDRVN